MDVHRFIAAMWCEQINIIMYIAAHIRMHIYKSGYIHVDSCYVAVKFYYVVQFLMGNLLGKLYTLH